MRTSRMSRSTRWSVCAFLALSASVAVTMSQNGTKCPLDPLLVDRTHVAWSRLAVGATLPEVEARLGYPLELEADKESPARHANVHLDGLSLRLDFRSVDGRSTLTGLSILRDPGDARTCWSREALIRALRSAVPKARYLPSPHAPSVAEDRNPEPTYALDDQNSLVVLIAPTRNLVYVGRLSELD